MASRGMPAMPAARRTCRSKRPGLLRSRHTLFQERGFLSSHEFFSLGILETGHTLRVFHGCIVRWWAGRGHGCVGWGCE